MTNDMNLLTLTVTQFVDFIREHILVGDQAPIIGLGKVGVGKTESIKNLAKELGIGYKELRLAHLSETEVLGIPYIENGRTSWAPNILLPVASVDGERGILVLDEITSCQPSLRAVVLQLLDCQRGIGNYKLPDGWIVVAMGNGPEDGGVFVGLEHAIVGRGFTFRVEPDFNSWKAWALKNGVHPSVVAFLSFAPQYLHTMNIDNGTQAHGSPRTWGLLSRKLIELESRAKDKYIDKMTVLANACGTVGLEVGSMFAAFYDYNKEIIKVEDILEGKANTNIDITKTEVLYLTCQNVVKALKDEFKKGVNSQLEKKVANLFNWVIDISNKSLDLAIMTMRDLIQAIDNIDEIILDPNFDNLCPRFAEFANTHSIIFERGK